VTDARAPGGARGAVAFLTPIGGASVPSPRSLAWFPAVGAGIGAALGGAWWGLSKFWPAAVVAAVVVGLDLVVTGMLHVDALVDAADGLLPHLARERRLAVMREPAVGAFGIAAGGIVLIARWAALFATRPSVLLLVALWTASRTAMAVAATAVPYARADGEGLATAFLGSRRPGWAASALGVPVAVVAAVFAHRGSPAAGPVALLCGAVAAFCVVRLAVRRVGGFTGDVLGASGVALETVGLLVAAGRW